MRTWAVSGILAAALGAGAFAQTPVFDAAVIRLNRSGETGSSIGQRPGGQYLMTNGPIYLLLMNAFGPQNREIREQLGLKLEPGRMPLQTLVIGGQQRTS